MVTLYCDLGDSRDVACGLVEPLHFEGGYADVDDEEQAAQIVARHQHIHYPRNHPDAEMDTSGGGDGESVVVTDESEAADETPESGTCDVIMSNGEVCGRELPCGYHP